MPINDSSAIDAVHVSVTYNDLAILDDISFSKHPGKIYAALPGKIIPVKGIYGCGFSNAIVYFPDQKLLQDTLSDPNSKHKLEYFINHMWAAGVNKTK